MILSVSLRVVSVNCLPDEHLLMTEIENKMDYLE